MYRCCLLIMVLLIAQQPAAAQSTSAAHEQIKKSLVELTATGVGSSGQYTGTKVGGTGTGFLVDESGLILTTYHLLTEFEKAEGEQLNIEASVFDGPTRKKVQATIVNGVPILDLLLVKVPSADVSYLPVSLNSNIVPSDGTDAITSGFHEGSKLSKIGSISSTSEQFWRVDLTIPSGMSGSPVYDKNANVFAMIKGSLKSDESTGIVVPIAFADAIMAHVRINSLQSKIETLIDKLGEVSRHKEPVHRRLTRVERGINDVGQHMTWDGGLTSSRDLVFSYKKLVSGDPHVSKVEFQVTPYVRYEQEIRKEKPMHRGIATPISLAGNVTDTSGAGFTGKFNFGNLAEKMRAKLVSEVDAKAITALEVRVIPEVSIDGKIFKAEEPKPISIPLTPEFRLQP